MSIWHELVENLLALNTEEGKKRILGACAQSPGSAPFLLWRRSLVCPCAGPAPGAQVLGSRSGRLSVCVSVCLSPGSCGKGAVPAARAAPPVLGVTGHRRG